jgi:hypothetical protein
MLLGKLGRIARPRATLFAIVSLILRVGLIAFAFSALSPAQNAEKVDSVLVMKKDLGYVFDTSPL